MKRLDNISKKGFTLVETMCTVAIIVTLLAATTIGVTDHLNRAHSTANIVLTSRKNLDAIDSEAFDHSGHSFSTSDKVAADTTTGGSSSSSSSSESPKASSGVSGMISSTNDISSDLAEAAAEEAIATPDPEAQAQEDARSAMIADVTSSISAFAASHNVSYLPGTENLPEILATAEVSAQELYEQKGFTDPRYFMYCPATGEIKLSTNDGKKMRCDDGQNFTRAILDEAAARDIKSATNGEAVNLRTQMTESYLNNSSKYIYIGVNKNSDGTYQIVPNVCIDVNGNFNSIITYDFDNGTRWQSDRNTFNADTLKNSAGQRTANWNGYVNFVTNASGSMLDLSRIDTSAYTSNRSNYQENEAWRASVQELRVAYGS
ncbi:prepilin-type N-terminal cleavage/methylation domain-containing protein [Ruminococcaceae bacterium YRB3002]|nr:prepilin-type N-terminal cleavage/methylation domain-containing protein [Ruminococcaceae bacterium YRB3002]